MSTFLWWRLSLTQGPHFAVLQHGLSPPSGGWDQQPDPVVGSSSTQIAIVQRMNC